VIGSLLAEVAGFASLTGAGDGPVVRPHEPGTQPGQAEDRKREQEQRAAARKCRWLAR
jgi:hypothetical protein